MSSPMFIFGGDTGVKSPQELKRLRSIAEALAGNDRAPKDVGEGLNAIGQALLYRSVEGKAGDLEKEGRESASKSISEALGFGAPTASATASPVAAALSGASIGTPGAAVEMAGTDPKPTSFSGNQQEFIASIMPAAIEEGKRTGVDPRIIVGQAALESGYGKHAPGNNYFGIKSHGQDGGNSLMTTEVVNGQPVRQRDSFRAYENPTDSVRGYGDFITQNPRYEKLRSAQGLDNQLTELQASGYATDPNYSRKVGSIARGIQLPGETASLDPSAGMSPVAAAIERQAPASGQPLQGPTPYRDPAVSAPNYQPPQQQQAAAVPPLPPGREVGPAPQVAGIPSQQQTATAPVQVAQAQTGPSLQKLYQALQDPWLSEGQQRLIIGEIQRQQQAADPSRQLDMRFKQAQLDALSAKPQKLWQRLDDGTLFNPETGETKTVSGPSANGGGFRFSGKSVEAQALNGLIDAGQLTEGQAQQLAAGKQITNPADGSIIFMTPQGIFGKPADGGPAQPIGQQSSQGVDIFAGSPAAATGPNQTPSPAPGPATSLPDGALQLTAPKQKDTQLPAEMGARIGLGDAFLEKIPGIRKRLENGDASGVIDGAQLMLGVGEPTSIWRDIESGRDALVRNLTGAGMSESEAQNQAARYQISPTDSAKTMVEKLDNLERDLKATRRGAIDARTGNMVQPSGAAGWNDAGDGIKIRKKGQ